MDREREGSFQRPYQRPAIGLGLYLVTASADGKVDALMCCWAVLGGWYEAGVVGSYLSGLVLAASHLACWGVDLMKPDLV
jgi:hypothetical protein